MEEPSDRALVLRTREGEVNAYGQLVRRYQNAVFNVCYRLLGERREAEDLAQEAFLRAYQRLDSFDPDRPFGPWIRRVATNLCYNHLQGQRPTPYELNEERDRAPGDLSHDPASALEASEKAERIRAAILQLPPDYRVVIELRHFQDMRYREIAEALNLSTSQVKTRLFRARKSLAKLLAP